jgi:hypothetical protein
LKRASAWIPVLVAAVLLTWSCGSSRSAATPGVSGAQDYGALSSELAVRTFLDAAAADDYPRMWRVFGTKDGPAVERFGIPEIEARMIVLARLLKNSGYDLRVANLASYGPDRVRYEVDLRGSRKGNVVVPVLTVPARGDRWFVEQLDMDALTASSLP